MLQNVLDMQENYVGKIVTPVGAMLILHASTTLNSSNILQYLSNGYSHIFVYNNDDKEQLDIIRDDHEFLGVLDLKVSIFTRDKAESLLTSMSSRCLVWSKKNSMYLLVI